jgi:hypothetical protein
MSERRRLIIELDPSADPVQGSIGDVDGSAESFSGYVQLIAALEGFRALDGYGAGGYRGEREDRGGIEGSGRGVDAGRAAGGSEPTISSGSAVAS